jgi:transcription elongation factor S-II
MSSTNHNDGIRNKCVHKINEYINNESISRNIEKGIFNYMISYSKENNIIRKWENLIFYNLYFSKIRSICLNVNKNSSIKNEYLINKINKREIKGEDIAKLSVYDINPDNWKKILDEKLKRDKIKYELKPEAMTDQYKCRRCGSRKCSYYEMQTRSADEPMTQFFTCLDCDNRWKM